jgi:hypothetical protein
VVTAVLASESGAGLAISHDARRAGTKWIRTKAAIHTPPTIEGCETIGQPMVYIPPALHSRRCCNNASVSQTGRGLGNRTEEKTEENQLSVMAVVTDTYRFLRRICADIATMNFVDGIRCGIIRGSIRQ